MHLYNSDLLSPSVVEKLKENKVAFSSEFDAQGILIEDDIFEKPREENISKPKVRRNSLLEMSNHKNNEELDIENQEFIIN